MENNQERNQELIQKAIDIIQDTCLPDGYCTLALMDTDNRPIITTITASKASGLEWITFCCGFGTRTERIAFCPDASVCFNSNTYHISLKGRMEVITDPAIKEDMWYEGLSLHFSGPQDPGYVVLKFIADSYTLFIDWETIRGTL